MPRCPVCKTRTDLIKYEGVPIYNCGTCGGHWLTKCKLDVILKRRELVMPEPVQRKMIELANASNSTQKLWCWNCGREMVKEAFRHWPEIQLDRCAKCGGIWLDRGELEKCQIYWEYLQDHPDSPEADRAQRVSVLEAQLAERRARLKDEAAEAADRARYMSRGLIPGSLANILTDLFD